MNKKVLLVTSSIIILGVFIIGGALYKNYEKERLGFLAADNIKLFYPDYAPSFGADDAKVIITEFIDPECESCRMIYPKVKKLLEMYKGKVKLVLRYAPFHQNSRHAIKVLEATRKQNLFWESLELLFEYQPAWASHHHPQPELVFTYLPEVGVDIEKVKKDMQDPSIENMIAQEEKDLQTLNVRATPTFFVNGQPLEAFGVSYLYSLVHEEVQKAYK